VLTPSQVEFGLIPREHWYQPDWIDEDKATKRRDAMVEKGIIYGGSVPYRNMCRFNSGVSSLHREADHISHYPSSVLLPTSIDGEIPLVLAH
jgi:alpha 1,2-mannosyltransferase